MKQHTRCISGYAKFAKPFDVSTVIASLENILKVLMKHFE